MPKTHFNIKSDLSALCIRRHALASTYEMAILLLAAQHVSFTLYYSADRVNLMEHTHTPPSHT